MHERTESRGFGAAPFQETMVELNAQESNRFVRRRIEIRILGVGQLVSDPQDGHNA